MLLPQPVRWTSRTRCRRLAIASIASHWPSLKSVAAPPVASRSSDRVSSFVAMEAFYSLGHAYASNRLGVGRRVLSALPGDRYDPSADWGGNVTALEVGGSRSWSRRPHCLSAGGPSHRSG